MAQFVIDQAGLPAGTIDTSRTDGLDTGALVTVNASGGGGTTFLFELLWVPPGDTTAVATLIATANPAIWTFAPSASFYGTYRIRLTIDAGESTEETVIRHFVIRTPNKNLVIPPLNSVADSRSSLLLSGPPQILASEDNSADYPVPALNNFTYAGWWRAMHELFLAADAGGGGGGGTLADTLALGNTSGANDIVLSTSSQKLTAVVGQTLNVGSSDNGAGNAGSTNVKAGNSTIGGGGEAVIEGGTAVDNTGGAAQVRGATPTASTGGVGTHDGGAVALIPGDSSAGADGAGGACSIGSGNAFSTNGIGGDITVAAGFSSGTASGPVVSVTGGPALGSGSGGIVNVTGGAAAGIGAGGHLTMQSGSSSTGTSGTTTVDTGSTTDNNTGGLQLRTATPTASVGGVGTHNAGSVDIQPGDSSTGLDGEGGACNVYSGNGQSTNGKGGDIQLAPGFSSGTGVGATTTVKGGLAFGTGTGGPVDITGGTSLNGDGGQVTITSGAAPTGTAGGVSLRPGTSVSTTQGAAIDVHGMSGQIRELNDTQLSDTTTVADTGTRTLALPTIVDGKTVTYNIKAKTSTAGVRDFYRGVLIAYRDTTSTIARLDPVSGFTDPGFTLTAAEASDVVTLTFTNNSGSATTNTAITVAIEEEDNI